MKLKKPVDITIMVLDQSFGSLRFIEEKREVHVVGIDMAPGTAETLALFKEEKIKTYLVPSENMPQHVLREIKQYLPSINAVFPYRKNISQTLTAIVKRKSIASTRPLLVAADRVVRGMATRLRCHAVSHPALVTLLLKERSLYFVRAIGGREQYYTIPEVIPYYRGKCTGDVCSMLAVLSDVGIAEAAKKHLDIEVLPLDLATEDPVFIQLNEIDDDAAKRIRKAKLLLTEGSRILVALGPAQTVESLGIHGPHGHLQHLSPNTELLSEAPKSSEALRYTRCKMGMWPSEKYAIKKQPFDDIIRDITLTCCPVTAESFQSDVDRYSGVSNLDSSGPVVSRNIYHPDNSRVEQALVSELNAIGYCAYTHTFTHQGLTLKNVIADLPGIGFYIIDPRIQELLRKIFIKFPFPFPPGPWLRAVADLLGRKWCKEFGFELHDPLLLRKMLEKCFCLETWYPWWRKLCLLPGPGAQLVIVGCHLDSTAVSTPGYNPSTDSAPGADDDASGIATTLALARYMWNFRRKLPHTVRFCFFNAEEYGLVGSKEYAAFLKSSQAPVKAVVCSDMLGYNSDLNRIFEVHAGYFDPDIRDDSVPIAETIASWSACLGALAPAQIYKGTAWGGPDRDLYDSAIDRSDHAAFHQQGYPAVVVSEDYFGNLPGEPGSDPNPNYHTQNDIAIDADYAADITCALAFAVKELAGG